MITTLVLASNNQGKAKEINSKLSPLGIEVVLQQQFDVPEIAETATTFVENALIKAHHAAKFCQYSVLADDSGLVVPALKGAPGIYSARYAGANGNDAANNAKLISELEKLNHPKLDAYFFCVMVLLKTPQDPTPIITQGKWHGVITLNAKGNQGFGYDPIFYVNEYQKTAAELDLSLKNKISHRGQAMQQLINELKSEQSI